MLDDAILGKNAYRPIDPLDGPLDDDWMIVIDPAFFPFLGLHPVPENGYPPLPIKIHRLGDDRVAQFALDGPGIELGLAPDGQRPRTCNAGGFA